MMLHSPAGSAPYATTHERTGRGMNRAAICLMCTSGLPASQHSQPFEKLERNIVQARHVCHRCLVVFMLT